MVVRDRVTRGIRKGVAKVCKILGVNMTYRHWNATTKDFVVITGVKMLRAGKATREDAWDGGVIEGHDETYTVNQDALKISGVIFEPSTRDQLVDGTFVFEVVDFNRDALDGTWNLHCKRMAVDRAVVGQMFRGPTG